jgi:hypothetical protein
MNSTQEDIHEIAGAKQKDRLAAVLEAAYKSLSEN